MEVAVEAVLLEKTTGGDDFDRDSRFTIIFTFHFAQIGCFPALQERLEQDLLFRALDVCLEVPTTGRVPGMVRGLALGGCAGIAVRDDRQSTALRRCHVQWLPDPPAFLHDLEPVVPEADGRRRPLGGPDLSLEPVGGTLCGAAILPKLEMLARDVNGRFAPHRVLLFAQRTEIEPFGVAEEPGGVVIDFVRLVGDAHGDVEGAAMAAEGAAGGWSHAGIVVERRATRDEEVVPGILDLRSPR